MDGSEDGKVLGIIVATDGSEDVKVLGISVATDGSEDCKVLGISVVTDGSEKGSIHSLNLGEEAAEAVLEIAQLTLQIQNQMSPVTPYLSSMMTKRKKWKLKMIISSLSL